MNHFSFAESELRILEMQPTPLAVYQFVDRHVYTLALSDGFLKLFGYSDRADAYRLSNQNALCNTHPDDVARVGDAVHRFAVDDEPYEVIFRAKRYEGQGETCRIVHGVGRHIYTDSGVRLAYVWFTDEGEYTGDDDTQASTLNQAFNSALHDESFLKANYYDNLTGLPNMIHFFALAGEGKAALDALGRRSAILYFDLNGMKNYNANFSFAEGDRLLKAFAQVLERAFGNENCCHINADRFVVFAEEQGLEPTLRRVFRETKALNGGNSLPVRVGIYSFGIEDVSMSAACDRAKYACDTLPKSDISGFLAYNREMRSEIHRRRYILSHLDRAISEKWIQVYYQPIVRAVNGRVCDEEALARWIDPVEGFLSPADFIPTLESAGMIYKLDLYVVDQVLEKIRTLQAEGLYIVPQSINLSRTDFDACDMVEEIRRRVDEAGIGRDKLTIEITESILGRDFEFIRTQVDRFRSLGFAVWMDDFGSGYSSLDVLQSIRFDLIKFDMSFMRKLEEGDSGKIILTELMKMATALGVDTICEGVETQEQARFLQTIGCSKLQGYYFLKPVPLGTILERYRKGLQIGFENPNETGYYDAVGRINLYDLSFMARVDKNVYQNTFDTIPMGIIEISQSGDRVRFVRFNPSYRSFMSRVAGRDVSDSQSWFPAPQTGPGYVFMRQVRDCCLNRERIFIDEQTWDGTVVHSFARRVFTNPITGDSAIAVAILSIERPREHAISTEYAGLLKGNAQFREEAGMGQKIAELQESVASLLTHMPGMTFSKDVATGRYLACNQAFAIYAQRESPEDVVGLTDYEIFDRETARHFAEDDQKALSMDTPYVFYEDVRDAAGHQKKFQTTKLKFIDSAGRQCLLGLCQDVTEAERIRQERDTTLAAYEEAWNASVIYARLNAITGNFICIYVVDPQTGCYREFSTTADFEKSFAQAKEGDDFFAALREGIRRFSHPDDVKRVLASLSKARVMEEIQRSGIFTLNYRLMMGEQPRYVQMSAAMVEEKEGSRLIVGVNDVDAQVRQREIDQEIARQKDIYDQITSSLAEQYDTLYYIDIENNTYVEISATDEYRKLNVPATGNDFFAESRRSIRRYVHPEDQEKVMRLHYKDVMLENLKQGHSFSMNWRLVVDGEVRYIRHTEVLSRDGQHIIVCIKNIDAEVRASLALKETQRKSVTYTQIAERLAAHYDMIYYIDCESEQYVELSASKKKSGELKIQEEGEHFFETARINANRLIHPEDLERIKLFLDRDSLISRLEDRRQITEDYRLVMDGGKTQFTRMSVSYSSDHSHFIICVENRDEDVRREQEHLAALSMANEMARRDELTHTKNKTAYREMESELQQQIDGDRAPFCIVVCDINDLKRINDTRGHKAGDAYIRAACALICRVFSHSPVFRIGGDEFVVVLREQDYEMRDSLMAGLKQQVEENLRAGDGPVVACGLSEYQPGVDQKTSDVFNRADSRMYLDKTRLKERKLLQHNHSAGHGGDIPMITGERRMLLDRLFGAFQVIAGNGYLYLCDMKYDFSRWSQSAVARYGLPSEYMYGAGDIWENQIHPEDRALYHRDINRIFFGNGSEHALSYRARRVTGEYDACTCQGVVLRDASGKPDYFIGTIRNHTNDTEHS